MKKLLSLIAVMAIVLSTFLYFPPKASEKSTYIRKIVSLVYDDSGSMKGEKWAYANYAVQSFCGMLNSEDQLYITYMSRAQLNPDYKPEEVDLSSGGIQKSVDTLRTHIENKDTPFKSVELAYNKLTEIECEDENAQYWLVVITDGVFDEIYYESDNNVKKNYLNEKFQNFAKKPMPNGSRVQTTFLSIGTSVASPDQNESLGIFTYNAENADGIIDAMSSLAHKVSGRTRVESGDIEQTEENAIRITTSLPLLNIAVVSQKTDAVIKKVEDSKGKKVPVTREVSVSYEGYSDLTGKTYLIGDSKKILEAGTYEIYFDKKTDTENLVIMLEPALEIKIFVDSEGKTYEKISDIEKMTNGEKITASYKVYKIGEDEEFPLAGLSENTDFNIVLYEDGTEVLSSSGQDMTLEEYTLTEKEVRIKAAIEIEGFNPIGSKITFVPKKYGSGDEFSIKGEFLNDKKSVKYSSISSNEDMGICFTVYEDGEPVTDVEKVKATTPTFEITPSGNEGDISYTDDGKIVFKPKKALLPSAEAEKFNVGVSCTIGGNKTATVEYTVKVSDYEMAVLEDNVEFVKTKFFKNEKALSFCIKKNGEQMDKNAIGENITVSLGEKYKKLKADIKVSDDGIITVRPYSEKEHKITFLNWAFNWWHYFFLEGSDMNICVSHELCSTETTVDVKGESLIYLILNVILPLLWCVAICALIISYLVCLLTKPKFTETATLYVGSILYNRADGGHILKDFGGIRLSKYNSIVNNPGRLKFSRQANIISVGGINIRPDHGGRLVCEMPFPWYKGKVIPTEIDEDVVETPELLEKYFERHNKLKIEEFSTMETINNVLEKSIGPAYPRAIKYIVIPGDGEGAGDGVALIDGRHVIKTGLIFIYTD